MSAAWSGGSTRAWRRLRAFVLDRDGWACRVEVDGVPCGAYADTADHVVPLSEGGAQLDPGNVRAACRFHNYSRGAGRPARSRSERPRPVRTWSW